MSLLVETFAELEKFETFTFESEIQPWAETPNQKWPAFFKSYETALRLQNAFRLQLKWEKGHQNSHHASDIMYLYCTDIL